MFKPYQRLHYTGPAANLWFLAGKNCDCEVKLLKKNGNSWKVEAVCAHNVMAVPEFVNEKHLSEY